MIAVEQLIKIAIGVFVIVFVVTGLYFFGNNMIDFFNNLVPEEKKESQDSQTSQNNVESSDNEEKSEEEVVNRCGECGGGFFNRCDENECNSLGNCEFIDKIGPFNDCR